MFRSLPFQSINRASYGASKSICSVSLSEFPPVTMRAGIIIIIRQLAGMKINFNNFNNNLKLLDCSSNKNKVSIVYENSSQL